MKDIWIKEGKEKVWSGLVGKLLSKKHVTSEVFKEIVLNLWRPEQGMVIS